MKTTRRNWFKALLALAAVKVLPAKAVTKTKTPFNGIVRDLRGNTVIFYQWIPMNPSKWDGGHVAVPFTLDK